jgi:heme/copper-type cytochrome/quinol oxidase subunit 2
LFSVAFVPVPSSSQHISLIGSCWFLYYCSQQHILEEKEQEQEEEEEFVDLFLCGVVVLVVVVVELVGSLMSSCRLLSRMRLR